MFKEWGFLLGEIWVLLILAALIGLIAGWLIWGRREADADDGNGAAEAQLKADLEACRAAGRTKNDRIAELEAALEAAEGSSAPVAAPVAASAVDADADFDGDGVVEGSDEGAKPATLKAARKGGADDLKKIKGIGPKLETLCNSLGFYHFDQIAGWTADEVAWVDANLEGFKGRVSRDGWVDQAKLLAEGGETAFSKKVDKGDVY